MRILFYNKFIHGSIGIGDWGISEMTSQGTGEEGGGGVKKKPSMTSVVETTLQVD